MEISPALELVGAALGHQLHDQIGALIDGNHVDRSELTVAQRRCCEAHIVYDVDWTFESRVETFRRHGNAAVSQHFGYDQAAYQSETAHRCEVGRTHQPLREPFMAEIAAGGGKGTSVTASRAAAEADAAGDGYRASERYSYRKILEAIAGNLERDAALLSRELSRRLGDKSPIRNRRVWGAS